MESKSIIVENLTKVYKLYDKPTDRIKDALHLTSNNLYREHYALHNINFCVNSGESVGIIGKNGSGKSTLLKVITGVLSPTDGIVQVNGKVSALLELGAGFNMEYSGIQNIYMNGTVMGFTKEEIDAKFESIVSFADIGEFINYPVKTYSSGMFVRLAFAVAINIEPDILIVDEALSVGDVFFQAKCYRKFQEFRDNGKTILFVSHDLSSINKYCDRVILLDKGNMVAEGLPKEIIDIYKKIIVNDNTSEEIPLFKLSQEESNIWSKQLTVNPSKLEYGNKMAEIIDFAIVDNSNHITGKLLKFEKFTIKMRIVFHENINDPIFAYTIKDLKGNELSGTNTMCEKVYVGDVTAGEERVVFFSQEMNLQGGEYLLSLGCTGYRDNEFTVYHRLYDICNFGVISDKDSVGFYDMNSSVEVITPTERIDQ